ncbi:MAG TPA: histidine kinase dimerization/phosphoacceptor domain -containing protein, partial [Candidatus Sulfotelmatobacter sp.]|nr:histidine kinase dimerization/phosphoacceptor domain -containing protein [Candidatus Sulfotelmatobacter sp.]
LNFAPRRLTDLLHSQRFPASWVAAINDRQHQVVARSPHIDQRIGKPVVSWLAAVVDTAESGIATGPLMDGRPGQIAFQRLREAPWTVNVAVPVAELEAAWRRPVLGFLLLGGFAALAAVGVALGLGRRIARPVTEAAHVAAGVIHGQAPTLPPSHIAEVAALQAALGDGAATVRAALQAREGAAAALREANATLEARVTERTRALEQANEALQKGNVELETASSELQETNVQLEEVNAELTHEIEGRGRAEAALRASEARLQLFIENAPAAIAMFDRDLCYLSASRRWRTDYGLGDRDLTGQSHYGILPEIPEAWKTVHRRGLAGEVVRAAEDCFTRQDGTVQWLSWEVRPWRTEDGAVGGIIIFTEDITERKRAEEALRTTLAQKDAALADKDALLREVHHRVKNNLQMLCDLMYLQMEAMPDRDQHQDLQDAYSRIYAIARLHEQIYQSMHSGQIQLAEYLRRVVSGFANLYPNVPVAVEAASVEVLIDLDRAIHVGLVVNELLTNAVKHAFPDGQPGQVSVAVCAAGDQIFLQVRDNGRGLPADLDLEHATSLGLRTVHILARRLEAKVTVSSSGGTSFTLTFPVRYDPPLEPA